MNKGMLPNTPAPPRWRTDGWGKAALRDPRRGDGFVADLHPVGGDGRDAADQKHQHGNADDRHRELLGVLSVSGLFARQLRANVVFQQQNGKSHQDQTGLHQGGNEGGEGKMP